MQDEQVIYPALDRGNLDMLGIVLAMSDVEQAEVLELIPHYLDRPSTHEASRAFLQSYAAGGNVQQESLQLYYCDELEDGKAALAVVREWVRSGITIEMLHEISELGIWESAPINRVMDAFPMLSLEEKAQKSAAVVRILHQLRGLPMPIETTLVLAIELSKVGITPAEVADVFAAANAPRLLAPGLMAHGQVVRRQHRALVPLAIAAKELQSAGFLDPVVTTPVAAALAPELPERAAVYFWNRLREYVSGWEPADLGVREQRWRIATAKESALNVRGAVREAQAARDRARERDERGKQHVLDYRWDACRELYEDAAPFLGHPRAELAEAARKLRAVMDGFSAALTDNDVQGMKAHADAGVAALEHYEKCLQLESLAMGKRMQWIGAAHELLAAYQENMNVAPTLPSKKRKLQIGYGL